MDAEKLIFLIPTLLLILSALRDWIKDMRESGVQTRHDLEEDYARVKNERDECFERVKSLETELKGFSHEP